MKQQTATATNSRDSNRHIRGNGGKAYMNRDSSAATCSEVDPLLVAAEKEAEHVNSDGQS